MTSGRAVTGLRGHLVRSTASNFAGQFVLVATWFFLTPFILDRLGDNLYGLWVLVGAVIGYGTLLDFGIESAVTKYVAEYRARNEWHQARELIGTALVLYLGLGLIVVAVSAVLAVSWMTLFNVPAADQSTAFWLVVITGLHFGLSIPCTTTSAILRGLQRFDLINLVSIASTLLNAAAIVIVLQAGGGPIGIVAVNLSVMLLMQIPSIWLIRRTAPELGLSLRGVSRRMARRITSFSSWIFMVNVGGRLESQTDEIVVGAALPVALVAPYNLARMLSTVPQMVAEQFVTLLLPLASEMDASKDRELLRSVYLVSTRVTLGVLLAIGLGVMLLGGSFLGAWVGPEYAGYGYLVVILTVASAIDTTTWPGGMVLQGMARHRAISVAALVTGLSNLGLSIILVGPFGLLGVALGTLIPTTLVCLGFVIPYCARAVGADARALAFEVWLPPLLSAVPAALTLVVLRGTLDPVSMVPILLTGTAGALVYTITYLCWGVCALERRLLRDLILSGWGVLASWFAGRGGS